MKFKGFIALAAAAAIACPAAIRCSSKPLAANIPSVTFSNFDSRINGGEPIRGVDISSIISLEEAGMKFYDDNGNVQDIFQVLADHGVNYIRVRIWNEPYDSNGHSYGGGHSDLETAAKIGKRAAEHGMKLLADIQYSDFWADPAKQYRPKYWKQHDHDTLKGEIYKWTSWVLKYLTENGSDIGMVQVGNETECYFCDEKDMYKICDLFSSGEKAVRDFSKDILIAHHFANPGNGHFGWYAKIMNECHLDYDVFATSYYSYWHGSLDNLRKVLTEIGDTYHKYVMVAETAYPYTNEDGDGFRNNARDGLDSCEMKYEVSVDGQIKALTDVFDTVSKCNGHGIGVFYWEPAWLGIPDISYNEQKALWDKYSTGWATPYAMEYDKDAVESGGSAFDNQALFDFHGNPLDSLDVFLNIFPQETKPVTTTTTTTTTEPVITKDIILGDINNDEVIEVYDVISLRKAVIVGSKSEELDLNGDKEVNIADLVKLQRYIQGHSDSDLSRRTINVRK